MRPLPQFDQLQPTQSVYNPALDDFGALLQPDQSNMDAWQAALDPLADAAVGASTDLFNTLDTIGSIFDSLDQTFGKINDSMADLDYSQVILAVQVQDKLFDDAVSSWAPDIGQLASGFINSIIDLTENIIGGFVDGVMGLINAISHTLSYLMDLVTWIIGQIGSVL